MDFIKKSFSMHFYGNIVLTAIFSKIVFNVFLD